MKICIKIILGEQLFFVVHIRTVKKMTNKNANKYTSLVQMAKTLTHLPLLSPSDIICTPS